MSKFSQFSKILGRVAYHQCLPLVSLKRTPVSVTHCHATSGLHGDKCRGQFLSLHLTCSISSIWNTCSYPFCCLWLPLALGFYSTALANASRLPLSVPDLHTLNAGLSPQTFLLSLHAHLWLFSKSHGFNIFQNDILSFDLFHEPHIFISNPRLGISDVWKESPTAWSKPVSDTSPHSETCCFYDISASGRFVLPDARVKPWYHPWHLSPSHRIQSTSKHCCLNFQCIHRIQQLPPPLTTSTLSLFLARTSKLLPFLYPTICAEHNS